MPTKQTTSKKPKKDESESEDVKIFADNRVVPISQVVPNSWNPKKKIEESEGNRRRYEEIRRALKRTGQVSPIIVREIGKDQYEIIDGFHRHKAIKELGGKSLEIKNIGKLSDTRAKALGLIIEKSKVPLDDILTAKVLKEMRESEEFDIEDVPFNQEELDKLIGALDFDWDKYKEEDGEGDAGAEGDGAGAYRVIIPGDYMAKWEELKDAEGGISDTEMICRLIDTALHAAEAGDE